MNSSFIHAGILLPWYSAGNHSYYGFMSTIDMSYLEDSISLHSFPSSISYIIFTSSFIVFHEAKQGWVVGERWWRLSNLGLNIHSHLFSSLWGVMRLCSNWYPLPKETSLTKLREGLVYEYMHKYLKGSLTVWPFFKTIVGHPIGLAMVLPFMGIGPGLQYQPCSFCEKSSNSIRKWLVTL